MNSLKPEEFNRNEILEILGIETAPFKARISEHLIEQLRTAWFSRLFDPSSVINEIKNMETNRRGLTQYESPFTDSPLLKGFCKKHYFHAGFLAQNCYNEVRSKLEDKIIELQSKNLPPYEFSSHLATFASMDSYKSRAEKRRLSGEWIVFGKYKRERYYLTLAKHKDSPEFIKKQIILACSNQFPYLLKG